MIEALSQSVTLDREDEIAVVTIDNPPVNALSWHVREGLVNAVARIDANEDVTAAVLVCAGRTFVSGADIKEFGKPQRDPSLDDALRAIEGSDTPIVAAIHGTALGGGLELAMTCHDRVAVPSAQFGLPEVFLGLVPGAGGTQRLMRIADLALTLELALEGKRIGAERAADAGLVSAVIGGDLRNGAIAHARAIAKGEPPLLARDRDLPPRDDALLSKARERVARKYRLEPARAAVLDLIEANYENDFDTMIARARATSIGLIETPESRALRHRFAAERIVTRLPGLPEGTTAREIAHVGVVGLGTMGCGIAACFAEAGFRVTAKGREGDDGTHAKARIGRILAGRAARESLDEAAVSRIEARVAFTDGWADLADADLVIESVSEDMEKKRAVFEALGVATRPGTILASNTSYLDIDALAEASRRPADVCGMHFFNPAHVMRLLENVRGAKTAPDVLATITALAKRIGKVPVLSGVCEGFIVNRMLAARSREVYFMLEEGAMPAEIDRALKAFGFPMGPLALSDLAGIDLQHAARQARLARLSEREKAADFVDQLFAMGRYGQKTGAGWYRYGEDRKPVDDPQVGTMLDAHSRRRGIERRSFSQEEIIRRCVHAMINEGAKILGEGIAERPHDIDVAMINGIGWPATTGGPMWMAGETGLGVLRESMSRFAEETGESYWQPGGRIAELADAGKTFYDDEG